jgi:hypothetical protein
LLWVARNLAYGLGLPHAGGGPADYRTQYSNTYVVCNRAPLDNVNEAMEESWNGYVHDDDRALLKVFFSICNHIYLDVDHVHYNYFNRFYVLMKYFLNFTMCFM